MNIINPQSALVKSFRKKNHLTQAEMSKLLGVHQATLSKWERGTQPVPGHIYSALSLLNTSKDQLTPHGLSQSMEMISAQLLNTPSGELWKAARTSLSLTQESLANRLCVSIDAIKKWERGIDSPLSMAILRLLLLRLAAQPKNT